MNITKTEPMAQEEDAPIAGSATMAANGREGKERTDGAAEAGNKDSGTTSALSDSRKNPRVPTSPIPDIAGLREIMEEMDRSIGLQAHGIEDIQSWVNRKGNPVYYVKLRGGKYAPWSRSTARKLLSTTCGVPDDLIESFLVEAMRNRLDYTGRIAGKPEGAYEYLGQKILALGDCKLPEMADRKWTTLEAVFEASLPDPDSRMRFQAWLFHAWKSLVDGKWSPLPALVLIGPAGSCKTLLLEIIRYVLGDQMLGHAYKYLSGRTTFNADLVGSPVLAMDDEIASNSKAQRVSLGKAIKNIAVTNRHRIEMKGVDGVELDPHWRIVIAANDEPEDLQILPELNNSLRDKLLMLHCSKGGLPMPARTREQKEAFWNALVRDIPGFLHHMHDDENRDAYGDDRMMVTGWQDSYVETALLSTPQDQQLIELIDSMHWWSDKTERTLRASELHSLLTGRDSPVRYEARRLLDWKNAAGTLLGKLAKSHPDRVQRAKPERDRKWTIVSPVVQGGVA